MDRLTTISLITGLPTLCEFVESCGESACSEACEDFGNTNCIGCPVQEAFTKLTAYEDAGLTVKEVFALKEEIDLQRNSVQVLSLWLTKIQKRLEKLTPGGSEFYNDPDKCLDWLQMQNASYKEQFKRRRKAEEELEQVKAELGAAVECIDQTENYLKTLERATEYIKPGTGVWHTVLKAINGVQDWRRKEGDNE